MIYTTWGDDFVEPTEEEEWAARMDALDRAARAEDAASALPDDLSADGDA